MDLKKKGETPLKAIMMIILIEDISKRLFSYTIGEEREMISHLWDVIENTFWFESAILCASHSYNQH